MQNYKKVVEDLVQAVSSQEKELADKTALLADLQGKLEHSGKLYLSCSFQVRIIANLAFVSAMQMPLS
jgi:2-succinyl-5-enolpyruvyl-6-hydroxy-3-cyclohexene-1-carboxylate synthase